MYTHMHMHVYALIHTHMYLFLCISESALQPSAVAVVSILVTTVLPICAAKVRSVGVMDTAADIALETARERDSVLRTRSL